MYSYQNYEYTADGGLNVIGSSGNVQHHSNELMQEIADRYKGANRIYKPFAVLFWQDCNNGKASNWTKL
jgi:hypothetical protein